jgi:hypothetical protein
MLCFLYKNTGAVARSQIVLMEAVNRRSKRPRLAEILAGVGIG